MKVPPSLSLSPRLGGIGRRRYHQVSYYGILRIGNGDGDRGCCDFSMIAGSPPLRHRHHQGAHCREQRQQSGHRGVLLGSGSAGCCGEGGPSFSRQQHVPFSTTSSATNMELLKELRARSGAPIVECKKALKESEGNDLNAAMDWLRQHGAAKAASKVQGRQTSEGLVGMSLSSNGGALVKVACETDFASRSGMCVDFIANVAKAIVVDYDNAAAEAPTIVDAESVLKVRATDNDRTVKDLLDEAVVAIRENLSISDAVRIETTSNALLVGYVHNRIDPAKDAGTAAAIVELVCSDDDDVDIEEMTLKDVGKKLAMHVVAAKPLYLSPDDVPTDVVEKERQLLLKQLQEEEENSDKKKKKPEEIMNKIVDGRLRKFYEMTCLTEQPHMIVEKNPKVKNVLDSYNVKVTRFELLSVS